MAATATNAPAQAQARNDFRRRVLRWLTEWVDEAGPEASYRIVLDEDDPVDDFEMTYGDGT